MILLKGGGESVPSAEGSKAIDERSLLIDVRKDSTS